MQILSRCPVTTRSSRRPQESKPSLCPKCISRSPRVNKRPFHISGQLNRNVFCGAGAPADQLQNNISHHSDHHWLWALGRRGWHYPLSFFLLFLSFIFLLINFSFCIILSSALSKRDTEISKMYWSDLNSPDNQTM